MKNLNRFIISLLIFALYAFAVFAIYDVVTSRIILASLYGAGIYTATFTLIQKKTKHYAHVMSMRQAGLYGLAIAISLLSLSIMPEFYLAAALYIMLTVVVGYFLHRSSGMSDAVIFMFALISSMGALIYQQLWLPAALCFVLMIMLNMLSYANKYADSLWYVVMHAIVAVLSVSIIKGIYLNEAFRIF